MRFNTVRAFVFSLSFFLASCGGGGTTGSLATVSSVSIIPGAPNIVKGGAASLAASVTYSDGSIGYFSSKFLSNPSTVSWSSSNTSVVTVSGSGVATGVAAGSSNITASMGGVTSATSKVTVYATTTTTQMGGARQGLLLSLNDSVSSYAGSGAQGSTDSTTPLSATFNGPQGITTDGTNLYVSENSSNNGGNTAAVRQIAISSGAVTTLASLGFSSLQGITTDGTNLYVVDSGSNVIYRVVIGTKAVTTFAGSGTRGSTNGVGTAASFNKPWGITTDGSNLYVTESNGYIVRQIVIATQVVTTLAGSGASGSTNGTGTAATFGGPKGITTDGTNLYVVDGSGIRKIVISTGVVTTLANIYGSNTGNALNNGITLYFPSEITTDGTYLYVSGSSQVYQIAIVTGMIFNVAGGPQNTGSTDGTGTTAMFNNPQGVTTDGTSLYVADTGNNKIRKIQ